LKALSQIENYQQSSFKSSSMYSKNLKRNKLKPTEEKPIQEHQEDTVSERYPQRERRKNNRYRF